MKIRLSSTLAILLCIKISAQPISKKQSAAIDNILTELSVKHKPATYIITNVSILTMKESELLTDYSVLVENGKIQKVGRQIVHPNATIIDGTGKYLMPGLTDMHVHLFARHPMRNTWILLLLINGVTTVRDMCGEAEKFSLIEKINRSEILGPTICQAGPIIDGIGNPGLFTIATTPQQGREAVVAQKKAGYDFIKVYNGLAPDVYQAIADEARMQSMLVTGHVPNDVPLQEILDARQNSIEHLTGYMSWKENQVQVHAPDNYASLTAGSGVWNCPTLYNHLMNGSRTAAYQMLKYADSTGLIPPGLKQAWEKRVSSKSANVVEIVDKYGESNFQTIKTIASNLYKADAKLVAGTDAGSLPLLIPGYALHQELEVLKSIGASSFDVLKMATINAAHAMNMDESFGTIEVGKRADLLLLNVNPLENIKSLDDSAGVMIRGIWLSKMDIEKLKADIKRAFGN